MKKIILVAVVVTIGWCGYYLYKNDNLIFLKRFSTTSGGSSHSSNSAIVKCVTKDDRVIYGNIPREITCEHTELVKGSLTVISDEAFKKEKGIERNSPSVSSSKNNNNASGSKCDGRIHCSQMRSCEEATFFLRNCPNVKMDGDNDGIPCENQWC